MPHQFPRRTQSWWRQTIGQYRASGLEAAAFAASVRAHPDTLRWWHRRLDDRLAMRPRLVPPADGAGAITTSPFVRVEVADSTPAPPAVVCSVEVRGVTLGFLAGSDPAFAGALVGALARAVQPC